MKKSDYILILIFIFLLLYSAFYIVGDGNYDASKRDKEFENRFAMLFESRNILYLSELYPGNWDYVCYLRPYNNPSNLKQFSAFSIQQPGLGVEHLWQILFINESKEIIDNYRISVGNFRTPLAKDSNDEKKCYQYSTAFLKIDKTSKDENYGFSLIAGE